MKYFFYSALFITLLTACNNNEPKTPGSENPTPGLSAPATISYAILKNYPHDTTSFTQGLTFYKGQFYEGTGNYGSSRLMEVDLATGKAKRSITLPKEFFGEGITILNDTVYQLTWKEKKVFAYTVKDFKKVKEFPINTEGWGITTDGKSLIVSDGTSNLYYYEPATFQLLHTQMVTQEGSPSFNLNELEYIDGYIYANQWQYPYIFKIEPGSGAIVGRIDLQQIWDRVKADDPHADVPNGIAHDTTTNKTYITGKNWPQLYEIEIGK
jgi:glutamine cyclotransferase